MEKPENYRGSRRSMAHRLLSHLWWQSFFFPACAVSSKNSVRISSAAVPCIPSCLVFLIYSWKEHHVLFTAVMPCGRGVHVFLFSSVFGPPDLVQSLLMCPISPQREAFDPRVSNVWWKQLP